MKNIGMEQTGGLIYRKETTKVQREQERLNIRTEAKPITFTGYIPQGKGEKSNT